MLSNYYEGDAIFVILTPDDSGLAVKGYFSGVTKKESLKNLNNNDIPPRNSFNDSVASKFYFEKIENLCFYKSHSVDYKGEKTAWRRRNFRCC